MWDYPNKGSKGCVQQNGQVGSQNDWLTDYLPMALISIHTPCSVYKTCIFPTPSQCYNLQLTWVFHQSREKENDWNSTRHAFDRGIWQARQAVRQGLSRLGSPILIPLPSPKVLRTKSYSSSLAAYSFLCNAAHTVLPYPWIKSRNARHCYIKRACAPFTLPENTNTKSSIQPFLHWHLQHEFRIFGYETSCLSKISFLFRPLQHFLSQPMSMFIGLVMRVA